jgi:hypothetical protein
MRLEGTARQNPHPVIARGFLPLALPMSGSASHFPGVVKDSSASVIRRPNRARCRLVGSNGANMAGMVGGGAKGESNGSWEEEAEERERDVRLSG